MNNERVQALVQELMPFMELVFKYEHLEHLYPFNNDYFRLDRDDITDDKRFTKIIYYLEYMTDTFKHSQKRFNRKVDIERYNEIRKELKILEAI